MQYFKLPAELITAKVPRSTLPVAAVLYAYCDRSGVVSKGQAELASLAHCDRKTVQRAAEQLQEAGFLRIEQTTRYDKTLGIVVRGRNRYVLDMAALEHYALIPYALLRYTSLLTPATFTVAVFLCKCADVEGRSHPSINYIARALHMAHSTVCEALKAVRELPLFFRQWCRMLTGNFSVNSYFRCKIAKKAAERAAMTLSANRKEVRYVGLCNRHGNDLTRSIITRLRGLCKRAFAWTGVVRKIRHQVLTKITIRRELTIERKKQRSIVRLS